MVVPTLTNNIRLSLNKLFVIGMAVAFVASLTLAMSYRGIAHAASGACTAPATDYGTVTVTLNISGTGSYYIWSRMAADSTADSSYLLQIDTTDCYTVGNSSAQTVPVYASGATEHFANDSSNWIDTDTSGTRIQESLSAGDHTIKLIGNAPNLVLDRLIFTQDSTCTPTGTGDNCVVSPDSTPPTVSVSSLSAGDILNNDSTGSPYNSSSYNITADASDASGITDVILKIDGSAKGSADTTAPYSFTVDLTGLSCGNHTIGAQATDSSPASNSATDNVTVKVVHSADINGDCSVNFLDISSLEHEYGKSSGLGRSDINDDGQVNFLDISALEHKYEQ